MTTTHDPGPESARARIMGIADAAAQPIASETGGWIRVGTASWTDPTMTAPGVFYPEGAEGAEERLTYYASQFPIVEVDATYYALPSVRTSRLWVERTPPDFLFDVKAHALMTGQPSEPRRLPKVLREALPGELQRKSRVYAKDLPAQVRQAVWDFFLAGIAPLRERGQLGSVLLQYPRWIYPSAEAREMIEEAKDRLEGVVCAVEFRHRAWLSERNAERTLRFLSDRGIPLVMVDAPQGFASSVPPVLAVTSPELAVVRFHGRRAEAWEVPGVPTVERYRYLYDRHELAEWVPRIREASRRTREVHVLMNNCYANYGTTNAREIAALLANALEPG
jgi:uncharacterized protein YecE (DUF72 family)